MTRLTTKSSRSAVIWQCQPILITKDLVLRLKAHDECERSPLALDAIQRL